MTKPTKEDIYSSLRQDIISGRRPGGSHLVETALASEFGVSRTPIREVLHRLTQDQLVVRSDRGLQVRESDVGEILDLYDVRIVLEMRAASLAAERRTELDMLNLLNAHRAMTEAQTRGVDETALANREFHRNVWKASHSVPLIDLLKRIDLHLSRYPVTTLSHPGRLERAQTEHAELLDCIRSRDSEGASRCAEQHFTDARGIRIQQWMNGVEFRPAEQ